MRISVRGDCDPSRNTPWKYFFAFFKNYKIEASLLQNQNKGVISYCPKSLFLYKSFSECDKTEKKRGVLNPTFQHFSVIDRSADIIRVQNKDADDVYLQPRPRPAQKMSECDSTEGYITVANPHNRAAVRAEVYDESDYYSIAVNKEQVYDSPYDQSQN